MERRPVCACAQRDLIQGEHSASYFQLPADERIKQGIPRIDQHIYARENGWAIAALAVCYGATEDATALAQATRAADWIIDHRLLAGGGFRHDDTDAAGPYLGDSVAMGRAGLALYAVTHDQRWLDLAANAADFIARTFANPGLPVGVVTDATVTAGLAPIMQRDENIAVSRFACVLFQHTGKPEHRELAARAFRQVIDPMMIGMRPAAVLLLADLDVSALDQVPANGSGRR